MQIQLKEKDLLNYLSNYLKKYKGITLTISFIF